MLASHRVFVSYSQESEAHARRVLDLADRLRADGVTAILDQHVRYPAQGWPRWCQQELAAADFVLMVCTATYRERFEGRQAPGTGRGVDWEGLLATQLLYDGGADAACFVPVLFDPEPDNAVPLALRGFPRYRLQAEYDALLAHLTGQHPTPARPVAATVRRLPEAPRRDEAPAATRLWLPFVPRGFVGREAELAQLHEMLVPSRPLRATEQPRVAIVGTAGMGKSHLAAYYASVYQADYRSVCWVDAGGDGVAGSMAALAERPLALSRPPLEPIADTLQAVAEALGRDGPHLVIFDNVDDPAAFARHVPPSGEVRVLLTSRRRDLQGVDPLVLGALPPAQALALLAGGRTWAGAQAEAARAICDEVGHLTLALALAARILSRPLTSPSWLLGRIRTHDAVSWSAGAPPDHLVQQRPKLAQLMDASIGLLNRDDATDRRALALLEVAGWFAPVAIPAWLLVCTLATTDTGAPMDEHLPEHDEIVEAARRVVELGLAEADDDGNLTFHRVIGACCRLLGQEAGRRRVLDALAALAAATPADTVALLRMAALAPHLETATSWLDAESPDAHWTIALRLAQHYKHSAQYTQALACCDRALGLLGERALVPEFLYVAGKSLHRGEGRYGPALAQFQRALALLEALPAPPEDRIAVVLNAIGQALAIQGKREAALDCYRRALGMKERNFGLRHTETAITLNAIGQVLQGSDPLAALAHMQRALDIKREALGPVHPEVAITLSTMGQVLIDTRRFEEALDCLRKSCTIKEASFGAKHPEVGITRCLIGEALLDQGNVDQARAQFEQALAILEPRLGTMHPFTVRVRAHLEA